MWIAARRAVVLTWDITELLCLFKLVVGQGRWNAFWNKVSNPYDQAILFPDIYHTFSIWPFDTMTLWSSVQPLCNTSIVQTKPSVSRSPIPPAQCYCCCGCRNQLENLLLSQRVIPSRKKTETQHQGMFYITHQAVTCPAVKENQSMNEINTGCH